MISHELQKKGTPNGVLEIGNYETIVPDDLAATVEAHRRSSEETSFRWVGTHDGVGNDLKDGRGKLVNHEVEATAEGPLAATSNSVPRREEEDSICGGSCSWEEASWSRLFGLLHCASSLYGAW